MGMFDYVYDFEKNEEFTIACPNCGHQVGDFQSKSGECTLSRISWRDCEVMLSECEKCKVWLDIFIEKTDTEYILKINRHPPAAKVLFRIPNDYFDVTVNVS